MIRQKIGIESKLLLEGKPNVFILSARQAPQPLSRPRVRPSENRRFAVHGVKFTADYRASSANLAQNLAALII